MPAAAGTQEGEGEVRQAGSKPSSKWLQGQGHFLAVLCDPLTAPASWAGTGPAKGLARQSKQGMVTGVLHRAALWPGHQRLTPAPIAYNCLFAIPLQGGGRTVSQSSFPSCASLIPSYPGLQEDASEPHMVGHTCLSRHPRLASTAPPSAWQRARTSTQGSWNTHGTLAAGSDG